MQDSDWTEQRRYPRARIQKRARYRIIHANDPERITRPIPSTAENIGGGGAMLKVKDLVTEGLHISFNDEVGNQNWLAVEIELLPGNPPIQILCKVVWYQKSMDSPECNFDVGIEFEDIREEDRKIIMRYVNGVPPRE